MRIENTLLRNLHVPTFGKKGVAIAAAPAPRSTLADDLKLFALTFACGFLFVSLYLA